MTLSREATYLLRAGLGYGTAVLTATAVTIALIAGKTLFVVGRPWTFEHIDVDNWLKITFIGLIVTTVSAFPGFVAALWVAAHSRWKSWSQFAWAGCGDAGLAVLLTNLFFYFFLLDMMTVWILIACLVGGFVGGTAYWFAAGRFLSDRRFTA